MKLKYLFLFIVFSLVGPTSFAQRKMKTQSVPSLTWDLGGSVGSYAGTSYSELDIGANFRFADNFNWRNVYFNRTGVAAVTASGLDSSLLFEYNTSSEDSDASFGLFAGPGVRFSNTANTGYFGEGGIKIRLGGLNLGLGAKLITYSSPGKDPVTGSTLSNTDLVYSIVLSGGGVIH